MADIREKYDEKIIKTKALKNGIIKTSEEKFKPIEEPEVVLKHREFVQTQELLVGLTTELFDQVQKMNPTKEESKIEEMNPTKEESKIEEMSTSKKTSKIEFTDLSWYRKKLNTKEKNSGTDSTHTKNSSKPKI